MFLDMWYSDLPGERNLCDVQAENSGECELIAKLLCFCYYCGLMAFRACFGDKCFVWKVPNDDVVWYYYQFNAFTCKEAGEVPWVHQIKLVVDVNSN